VGSGNVLFCDGTIFARGIVGFLFEWTAFLWVLLVIFLLIVCIVLLVCDKMGLGRISLVSVSW